MAANTDGRLKVTLDYAPSGPGDCFSDEAMEEFKRRLSASLGESSLQADVCVSTDGDNLSQLRNGCVYTPSPVSITECLPVAPQDDPNVGVTIKFEEANTVFGMDYDEAQRQVTFRPHPRGAEWVYNGDGEYTIYGNEVTVEVCLTTTQLAFASNLANTTGTLVTGAGEA